MNIMNELRQPYLDEFESGGGDSFEEVDITEDIETIEPETEETIEDTPQAEGTKPAEEPYKIKVKFNHQEMDIPEDEASVWIQKGLNYDKGIERAKQEAAKEAENRAYTEMYQGTPMPISGKPILSKADYEQGSLEQKTLNDYQGRGIPEDVISDLAEFKKDKIERQAEKQSIQNQQIEIEKQALIQKDAVDFFNWFRAENQREFEVGKDEMPPELWQAHLEGKSLIAEYSRHENNKLKQELKILKQNSDNLRKAPVNGVTAHGGEKTQSDAVFLGFDD